MGLLLEEIILGEHGWGMPRRLEDNPRIVSS
jgi:hypothetical protein